MPETTLSEDQLAELTRLKAYFPYRIVYGAISGGNEWICGAVTTKREPNRLARTGWHVVILT